MKANEALGAMLKAAGINQSRAAEVLGLSRQIVSMDVLGHVKPGQVRGMTVGKLIAYARACGYRLVLVPDDPAKPELEVDDVNRGRR